LRNQGIAFIKPSPEALKVWFEDASEVPKRLIKSGRLSQEMVDTLNRLIKEYRSKESGANE
jgi:hypothetical protein